MCCRCGKYPRTVSEGELTYLCNRCLGDPKVHREVAAILRAGGSSTVAQRRVAMVEYGWAGGWSNR